MLERLYRYINKGKAVKPEEDLFHHFPAMILASRTTARYGKLCLTAEINFSFLVGGKEVSIL